MAEEKKQETPAAQPEAAAAAAAPAPAPVEVEVNVPAPALPAGQLFIWGTGRRKSAVARVRIRPGKGEFHVNKRPFDQFFTDVRDRDAVTTPLAVAKMAKSWDIWANVNGGGFAGQAGAVRLGLSRALLKAIPELLPALRELGLLTRDSRMKERKKYGQKGARKAFQWTKR